MQNNANTAGQRLSTPHPPPPPIAGMQMGQVVCGGWGGGCSYSSVVEVNSFSRGAL